MDVWRVLDEKIFDRYSAPFQEDGGGIGFFKQDCMQLFKSFYDCGLLDETNFELEIILDILDIYLFRKFKVPYSQSRKVRVLPNWIPATWRNRHEQVS